LSKSLNSNLRAPIMTYTYWWEPRAEV